MRNGSRALQQQDFRPLALNGWGDGWNAYVHSMDWFEGRLYCGTFRANMCLKRRQKIGAPQWPVWPIKCPDNVFKDVDLRAQIWRFSPATATWELSYRSPTVKGRNGQDVPRECGYRGLAVVQGKSDRKPVLYVTPFSNTNSIGPVILRSEDGQNFRAVSKPGLGFSDISSFRFLVPFRGRLYTSPIGSTQNVANQSKLPIVFESADPAGGEWRSVSLPGFGDPTNSVVFSMAMFDNHLYAGTFNHVSGLQLWKTRAEGPAPYSWRKVLDSGAGRGNFNEGVMALCEFNGALYVGVGVQDGGYDRVNRIGPAAAEMIRVHPDDTWDLIVGDERITEYGLKRPVSGLGSGFNNPFNGYVWRMCVHDNHLYAGTLSWKCYLPYLDREKWPPGLSERLGIDERDMSNDGRNRSGGFEVWSSADGNVWSPVTKSGFGNAYNCGARSLVSTPYGLAVGTVNPFGPHVAVRQGSAWTYVPNSRGGAEVWIGSSKLADVIRRTPPLGGQL